MPDLILRDRREGTVPPRDPRTGYYRLTGERDWLLGGEAACLDAIQAALGSPVAERLDAELLLLHFGNRVGQVILPHLGGIEVVSGKWDEATFEQMLADLMEVASALPFTADTATALPYERAVTAPDQEVLYHAFVYVRHILSEAAPASERLLPPWKPFFKTPTGILSA